MYDFMTLALQGKVQIDEIDDFIDAWRLQPHDALLSDFLGMTKEEYARWVQRPEMLSQMIRARHDGIPLSHVIAEGARPTPMIGQK
jgi:hypothetical protein